MKTRLQKSIKDVLEQAKKADVLLEEIKSKVAKFDKEAAKTQATQLKSMGLAEVSKLRDKLQHQLVDMSVELAKTSEKLKVESDRVKSKVQDTLKTVKAQVKTIAENERLKRRGRSRSE